MNANEIPECSICLDPIQNDFEKLSCNHTYHKVCIKEWFETTLANKRETTCPLCKRKIDYIKPSTYKTSNSSNKTSPYLIILVIIAFCSCILSTTLFEIILSLSICFIAMIIIKTINYRATREVNFQ